MPNALDIVDSIRANQPTALPLTVVVDIAASKIIVVAKEEITDMAKSRVSEKAGGFSVAYKIDEIGINVV